MDFVSANPVNVAIFPSASASVLVTIAMEVQLSCSTFSQQKAIVPLSFVIFVLHVRSYLAITTLTVDIPDDNSSLLFEVVKFTKNTGLKVVIDDDEDNLTESEFQSLKNPVEEAVVIKKRSCKGYPRIPNME